MLEAEFLLAEPLISVVIPTHNRCDLLIERSLPSVLGQTYSWIEVIVVAHGCTDDTVEQVKRLNDPRIRIIELPRKQTYPPTVENHWCAGRVAAANAGLKECRGDWIATNDDDDAWHPTLLSSLLWAAKSGDFEFVSAGTETSGVNIEPYEINGVRIGSIQTWLYKSYLKGFKFNPQCWRKKWNKVCDVDLQDRFYRAGVQMGYLNKVLANIIPRPNNTTIGLKAAKDNPESYMRHLEFK